LAFGPKPVEIGTASGGWCNVFGLTWGNRYGDVD